jgi:hemoglobin
MTMTISLYEKYGGLPTIIPIVESFYRRVLANDHLQPYFRGVNLQKLSDHQVNFIAVAMGAPSGIYTGRPLREAHAHLRVTDDAFALVAQALEDSLREAGVEEEDVTTMVSAIVGQRGEVVAA